MSTSKKVKKSDATQEDVDLKKKSPTEEVEKPKKKKKAVSEEAPVEEEPVAEEEPKKKKKKKVEEEPQEDEDESKKKKKKKKAEEEEPQEEEEPKKKKKKKAEEEEPQEEEEPKKKKKKKAEEEEPQEEEPKKKKKRKSAEEEEPVEEEETKKPKKAKKKKTDEEEEEPVEEEEAKKAKKAKKKKAEEEEDVEEEEEPKKAKKKKKKDLAGEDDEEEEKEKPKKKKKDLAGDEDGEEKEKPRKKKKDKVEESKDVVLDEEKPKKKKKKDVMGDDWKEEEPPVKKEKGSKVVSAEDKSWPDQKLVTDFSSLHPLSPVVMHRQATINIGTIGHVAHGKSTVVKAISGVQTVRFKTELQRNITIKLGYANAKIFKCDNPKCPRPDCYRSMGSSACAKPRCQRPGCDSTMTLQRHVSFVDCPGHDILMATMLNGAAVMDASLLLIAGNESCPQPQTSEHLAAVEIMKLKNIIILQNKIDLVKEKEAASQFDEIGNFIRGTVADGAPIVPISAQLKYNIEAVCEYICTKIPIPPRIFDAPPRLIVIRSFDVNKPGFEVEDLKGGVAGGSVLQGVLKVGQEIEVRPGIVSKDTTTGRVKCTPIRSRIISLFTEHNNLDFAVPGGLIGVGTQIDPTLTRADRLVGQVLGEVGHLPEIFTELEISYFLLRRLLGVKAGATAEKKLGKVKKLEKGEVLMVNIGSTSTGARILRVEGDLAKVALTSPVCTSEGEKLALSRRVEKNWRLIGWGEIRSGVKISQSGLAESSGALDEHALEGPKDADFDE